MFSVLNAIVLKRCPTRAPQELAILSTHAIPRNQFDGTSAATFHDWQSQSKSFSGMTLYRRTSASRVVFAGADAPQRAQEGLVGQEFFNLLGAPVLIGRTFSREEFDRGERVVVLSEGLWRKNLAGPWVFFGRTLSNLRRGPRRHRRDAAVVSIPDRPPRFVRFTHEGPPTLRPPRAFATISAVAAHLTRRCGCGLALAVGTLWGFWIGRAKSEESEVSEADASFDPAPNSTATFRNRAVAFRTFRRRARRQCSAACSRSQAQWYIQVQ